jgi:hypothetical protein
MPVCVPEMAKKRRKLLALGGILLAIAVAAFLYNEYRAGVMARLYAEAAGYPPYYRGSIESQAAVKSLASYRGQRSTSMLLDIALRQNPLAPEAQTEAIKALSRRKDPQIALRLASLLQPQEGLDTRKAAAAALQNLPCNRECIASILHYLERIWRGEPNDEDRWVLPPGNERVIANYRAGQRATYDDLYSVLRREKRETFTNLVSVYGLGSDGPSPFALELVSRLELHEACPYLQESERQLKDLSPDRFKAPRQEIQDAIASLNCK